MRTLLPLATLALTFVVPLAGAQIWCRHALGPSASAGDSGLQPPDPNQPDGLCVSR